MLFLARPLVVSGYGLWRQRSLTHPNRCIRATPDLPLRPASPMLVPPRPIEFVVGSVGRSPTPTRYVMPSGRQKTASGKLCMNKVESWASCRLTPSIRSPQSECYPPWHAVCHQSPTCETLLGIVIGCPRHGSPKTHPRGVPRPCSVRWYAALIGRMS